jgi:hypothetical protein
VGFWEEHLRGEMDTQKKRLLVSFSFNFWFLQSTGVDAANGVSWCWSQNQAWGVCLLLFSTGGVLIGSLYFPCSFFFLRLVYMGSVSALAFAVFALFFFWRYRWPGLFGVLIFTHIFLGLVPLCLHCLLLWSNIGPIHFAFSPFLHCVSWLHVPPFFRHFSSRIFRTFLGVFWIF